MIFFHATAIKKYCISIDHEWCFLTVSCVIQVAVELSKCLGVGVLCCPNSLRINPMIFHSLQLTKRVLSPASAMEAATNRSGDVQKQICPFNMIGCLS